MKAFGYVWVAFLRTKRRLSHNSIVLQGLVVGSCKAPGTGIYVPRHPPPRRRNGVLLTQKNRTSSRTMRRFFFLCVRRHLLSAFSLNEKAPALGRGFLKCVARLISREPSFRSRRGSQREPVRLRPAWRYR